MIVIHDNKRQEKYIFRCPKCKTSQSVRKGSFFKESRLSIPEILYVTFCWAAEIPVRSASAVTGVCERSISQWYIFLREKCSGALICSQNYMFGGPGVVVQIDESVELKRKYDAGCNVDQQWICGIYDTTTKLGHIQLVNDRSAQTLIPIIQQLVRPGTTIFSYQSTSAYAHLGDLGYNHITVNRSQSFVDPTTGISTNAIEAYWSRVKRSIRLHKLSDSDQLALRIDEFLWRDRLLSKKYIDAFREMLRLIANN